MKETEKPKYNFTLTIHLPFNFYDLRDHTTHESEECYELEEPIVWEENMPYGVVKFNISNAFRDDGTGRQMPDHYFLLTISGVQVHTVDEAWAFANDRIEGICKALTLLLNTVDIENKGAFQPRVYPDYSTAKETHEEIQQDVERKEDDGIVRFTLNETIHMRKSFYMTAVCTVHNATDVFKKYYFQPSYRSSYIMDQLYMALGNEKMSSKFFHLAAIIEFVEREYDNLSGSRYLFPEEADQDNIRTAVTATINGLHLTDIAKKKYLDSACGNNLEMMTDIGREEKLKNILHAMGISTFKGPGNKEIKVTKRYCGKITKLRNKYFHASDTKDGKMTEVSDVVAEMICLCMKIADYAEETDIRASIQKKIYQSVEEFASRCNVKEDSVKRWIKNKYIQYREVVIDKKKVFDISEAAKKPYTDASRVTSKTSVRETIMKATYLGYHITSGMFSRMEVMKDEFDSIIDKLVKDEKYIIVYQYDFMEFYLPTEKLEEWGKAQGLEGQVLKKFKEQAVKQAEEYRKWVPNEDDEKYRLKYVETE